MSIVVELVWRVVKLTHLFIFAVDQVTVKELLHHDLALFLGQVTDNVSTHESQLLGSNQFIKDGEDLIRICIGRISPKIVQIGQNERFLLILADKSEKGVVVALGNRKYKNGSCLRILHQLHVE